MKKEAFLFTLFSLSAGIIQISSFSLLNLIDSWSYWSKYLVSVLLSVLWNFTFNRKVTFKGTNNIYLAMSLTLVFYVFFIPITTILGNYFEKNLNVNGFLILIVTMILNFVLEFVYTKFVIYKKGEEIADV